MVLDPRDPNSRSCGSFFVNPVVDETAYREFAARVAQDHPHFPAGQGRVKLAAAWLIEQAGFHKGYRFGRVGLSEKHCLAIVNRDGGSAAEIHALAQRIQTAVAAKFGVELTPEPLLL